VTAPHSGASLFKRGLLSKRKLKKKAEATCRSRSLTSLTKMDIRRDGKIPNYVWGGCCDEVIETARSPLGLRMPSWNARGHVRLVQDLVELRPAARGGCGLLRQSNSNNTVRGKRSFQLRQSSLGTGEQQRSVWCPTCQQADAVLGWGLAGQLYQVSEYGSPHIESAIMPGSQQ
jgi:hypothetical protein